MEKEFIDLVVHVFTLQWATWAIPVSLLASMFIKRIIPGLIIAIVAVVIHHIGPVALPALLGGEGIEVIVKDVSNLIPKLEPISILAEYIAYAYLIVVFSLTRRDMFRPGVHN
jgi:hypothetical protein